MEISIMIEGQMGLNWARWKNIVRAVEDLGFAGLFRSDHFTNPQGPIDDSLELIVSLTYAAEHTERIHFGQLVSPLSFREPVMMARQAAALNELSGGRMIFGVGAGWQDREHEAFGYELGDTKTRLDRLEEGLEVITRLLRSEEPVSLEGRFYQLKDAQFMPIPAQSGSPPILVGGNGPKRLMPMAAKYADWWNGAVPTFGERSAQLDDLLQSDGRKPGEIKKTAMTGVFFGKTEAEAMEKLGPYVGHPALKDKTPKEILALLRENGAVAGTAEMAKEALENLEKQGVQEVMLQWLQLDDLEGLEAFAQAVL